MAKGSLLETKIQYTRSSDIVGSSLVAYWAKGVPNLPTLWLEKSTYDYMGEPKKIVVTITPGKI